MNTKLCVSVRCPALGPFRGLTLIRRPPLIGVLYQGRQTFRGHRKAALYSVGVSQGLD